MGTLDGGGLMGMFSPAFATPTLLFAASLQLVPTSAAAQNDGLTLRSLVLARCGAELASYEETVPAGISIFQGRGGEFELDPSRESINQVGAWLSTVYPLLDAFLIGKAPLRPEQRRDVASSLGRALDLTRCLMPSSAQLDVYKMDGPPDAAEIIQSAECYIPRANIVYEAMLTDMGATELRALREEQSKAASACASEDLQ
ncbi:hypothetical protein [Rhodobacter ferrooxidans]|uniref:hypothetical protein n=1 Tax=Rhodobacter ferrooxidans TaxID=371731 RepID=UPI001E34ADB1|nr:hypothetical protein [Rhodobacter sp. SW2]